MNPRARAWIELSEENLTANIAWFRKKLPEGCEIMAAVKANAYGHGAALVAGILQRQGVESFCVASLSEGVALRNAGIRGQILILGYTYPDSLGLLSSYDLTQTVVDCEYAEILSGFGQELKVQIGIDTGMHRLGADVERTEDILKLFTLPHLKITGVFSHLCAADGNTEKEREYTRRQIEAFKGLIRVLKQAGKSGFKAHLMSSYGALNYPEERFDYVRLGIALYGTLSRKEEKGLCPGLRPVLTLKARVQCVRELKRGEEAGYGLLFHAERDSRLAVLSIGYADGIPRGLSEEAYVLIGGQRAPVAGRICMDQMTVDVTDIAQAAAGDEAVLIGKSGKEEITAAEFADWAGTIANEVLSRLGERLMRVVE